ncbi:MAG TPA: hypothetical protein VGM69_05290 [Chloroflexota bacterium]|jgi:hypothetical protein
MFEYLPLVLGVLRATLCDRGDLVVENLLLRQQLAILTRPTRKRPHLRGRDKLFWLLARLARRDWRRHLLIVTPETIVRWLSGADTRSAGARCDRLAVLC